MTGLTGDELFLVPYSNQCGMGVEFCGDDGQWSCESFVVGEPVALKCRVTRKALTAAEHAEYLWREGFNMNPPPCEATCAPEVMGSTD